jgi:hypothetical protein
MIEKEFDKIRSAIAKAREQALLSPSDSSLKSHGKLFGMDAFSWQNPNISVLEKTIESFPFRTVWLGNYAEINAYIKSYDECQKKVEEYIIYGECQDIVKKQKDIKHFLDIKKSIKSLEQFSFSPGIILFTASDSDGPYSMNYFSSLFQKLNQ